MATIPQPAPSKSEEEQRISFRVSEDLWERLNVFAVKNRMSVKAICTEAVIAYMNAAKKEPKARAS